MSSIWKNNIYSISSVSLCFAKNTNGMEKDQIKNPWSPKTLYLSPFFQQPDKGTRKKRKKLWLESDNSQKPAPNTGFFVIPKMGYTWNIK